MRRLRDLTDVDFVDETMLATGALDRYRLLVIAHGSVMETEDARRIAEWTRKGGNVLVLGIRRFESVEGDRGPEDMLFGPSPWGRKIDKGEVLRVRNWKKLSKKIEKYLTNMEYPIYDLKPDKVFGADLGDGRFLFLNAGENAAFTEVKINDRSATGTVPARSIAEIKLR
ncbi:MAG: hypothetical protein HYX78_11990 [Armatimonadetes bacterium]|nr:hypothetical protein [Armatimonadota bacterium]